MPFESRHVAFAHALAAELAGGVTEAVETTVCALAEASLRHAYPGATAHVSPAPDRPEGERGRGTLDVRLAWAYRAEPPLLVRVVVNDELARGAWGEASTAIGAAVGEALAARQASPPPKEKPTP